VTERFLTAKTPAEAKPYVLPSFHAALDVLFATPDDGSSSDYEITGDGPAPTGVGGHFVGVAGQLFMPEAGRRVRMEIVFHLIERDGWKVADFLLLAIDGQILDPPISVAANYREMVNPAPPVGGKPVVPGAKSATTAVPAKQWYEDKRYIGVGARGLLAFVKAGGIKAVGLLVLAVGTGVFAAVRLLKRIRIGLQPEDNAPKTG
jgi:hypothetical protein